MIQFIFAIRDRAVDGFMRPFFSHSVGMAVRSFSDEVNNADPNNVIHRHPDDYDLFQLGTFDSDAGSFDTHLPKQVAVGKECVKAPGVQPG